MDALTLSRTAQKFAALDHPDLLWLRAGREHALQQFANLGLPTTTDEDWRYTDLRPLAHFIAKASDDGLALQGAEPDAAIRAHMVGAVAGAVAVFANGVFRADLSTLPAIPGVSMVPLSLSPPQSHEDLARRVASTGARESSGLSAFKAALLRDGLTIDVAPGVAVPEPIYIVFAGSHGNIAHSQVMIRLATGSKATFVEHHLGTGTGLSACTTDMGCADDSQLSYIKLQETGDSAYHLGSQRVTVGRGASANLLHLDLGARLARNDLRVDLAAQGAEVNSHGLFFADGQRHLDNHTRIDHLAPQTRSREVYRGIMDGTGRGVFNGKIVVRPGADKADAQLRNQNLLLCAGAEVDTKPELEIYADDVKCGHGATTGQLDRDSIFYLRSRGIPEDQARRLLIASFAREIVGRLPAGPLEEHVVKLLGDRLPGLTEAGRSP